MNTWTSRRHADAEVDRADGGLEAVGGELAGDVLVAERDGHHGREAEAVGIIVVHELDALDEQGERTRTLASWR